MVAPSIQYRTGRAEDLADAARMISHSFPGQARSPTWWEEQLRDPSYGGGAETLVVGHEGERLVAACQIHPLRQWIAGERFAVAGVGTVAISPAHRKRRIGGQLVTEALRLARDRGDLASALYPFRVSFYQKLGYGNAGEALQYLVPPDAFPDSPERHRVELLETDAGRREALELYGAWARSETGQMERGARVWEEICDAADRALFGYHSASGALEGYAVVVYRMDLSPQERYLEVLEMVWSTPAARRGLYGWLGSLGDQWHRILLRALPAHRLGDWLREPRLPWGALPGWGLWAGAAGLMMGPMFRLVDLAGAWERRRVAPGPGFAVRLKVKDDQLADNAGSWVLRFENGRVSAERGGSGMTELHLELDVSTLSRLFVGSLSASQALATELLVCDRPELLGPLDRALRLPEPWTFDRF